MNYNSYPFGKWIKWGVLALVVVILVVSMMSTYNGLAAADQDVKGKWSQVENQMQRRADSINNLVETVKGSVKMEESIISDIADARSTIYSGTADVKSKLAADATIARSMNVIVENYPQIKSTEAFTNLQIAIEGSENRVSVARKDFIDSVQTYNTKITRFPGNIFARLMGFGEKNYFEADPDKLKAPEIKF